MPTYTFDQFAARLELRDALDSLRRASLHPKAHRYERCLLDFRNRGEDRLTLVSFARTQVKETFIATVAGRGFNGKRRTVLLQDLRLFGSKFIQEDHLWVPHDRQWERIEPFFQGQKVVLVGTATPYMRKNTTCDYTLAIIKVTKLWLPAS
jgi:hypothetical protein